MTDTTEAARLALKRRLLAARLAAAASAQPSAPATSLQHPVEPHVDMSKVPYELQKLGIGLESPTGVAMGPDGQQVQAEYSDRTQSYLPSTAADATGTQYYLDPATGAYQSRDLMTENQKRLFDSGQQGAGTAFIAGSSNGVSLGAGDEIAGYLMGDRTKELIRAQLDAAREKFPKTTTAGEIAGAVSLPIGPGKAATLGEAVKAGAKAGALMSGVYGAADANGGAMDRISGGLEGAISGAIIGGLAPVAIKFGSKVFQGLASAKPSLESLKAAKSAAYKAVDAAGETFSPAELQGMVADARQSLTGLNYLPEADKQTAGVLSVLDTISQQTLTLGQLDKMRQDIWRRYNTSKEVGLLNVIDAIDTLVSARQSTSELMDAARLANARFKKAELLDLGFQKAADQTASTGSGGNILNKYRQVVTSIIDTPQKAKWFTPEEIAVMRKFVRSTPSRNFLRLIGKLAPTGNGLMTALNLAGSASFGAPALAVSAAASGAKALADKATQREAGALIAKVAGKSAPPLPPITSYSSRFNALGGIPGVSPLR